jgi:hypothetical protein
MKLTAIVVSVAALVLVAPAAAKAKLQPCHVKRGQNHYSVTKAAPGCAFGSAAYNPLMRFALSGAKHGKVGVRYRRHTYRLSCALTYSDLIVSCEMNTALWVDLYLDSSEPPSQRREAVGEPTGSGLRHLKSARFGF